MGDEQVQENVLCQGLKWPMGRLQPFPCVKLTDFLDCQMHTASRLDSGTPWYVCACQLKEVLIKNQLFVPRLVYSSCACVHGYNTECDVL